MLSLMNRIYKPPASLSASEEPVFYTVVMAGWSGLFVHACFLAVFLGQDINAMAAVNIAGVLAWSAYIGLALKGRMNAAIYIACLEIVIHAICVVMVLGTQYGFHFYLINISLLLIIKPSTAFKVDVCLSILCLILFAVLEAVFPQKTTTEFLPNSVPLIFSLTFLTATASTVAGLILFKSRYDEQHQSLEFMATHDVLTGLRNRRFLFDVLRKKQSTAENEQKPFHIAIGDIDHFKQINDRYGHGIGDEALVDIARFIKLRLSETDEVARWGGEEFLFYLADADINIAFQKLDVIRAELAAQAITQQQIRVTMSFGLASVTKDLALDASIQRADDLLYQAKEAGRNRIVCQSSE